MGLFSINSKMRKSVNSSYKKIVNFAIPAFKTKQGFSTCPNAALCASACYARVAFYLFPKVYEKHNNNLQATFKSDFINLVDLELHKVKPNLVRIHDSGDFYNEEYLNKWITIARLNSNITFYAYTKMVSMVKSKKHKLKEQFPSNLVIIFSLGGKEDGLVNRAIDRHSRVFSDLSALESEGYINASQDDTRAIGEAFKIGLVYHHPKKWENTAWEK